MREPPSGHYLGRSANLARQARYPVTAQWTDLLRRMRQAAALRQTGGTTDGQLLGRFVAEKDEAAFEALVRQHGPMVLGVCPRVLNDVHEADDAFQATFLVLVRK